MSLLFSRIGATPAKLSIPAGDTFKSAVLEWHAKQVEGQDLGVQRPGLLVPSTYGTQVY
jgi:hypothetical protein